MNKYAFASDDYIARCDKAVEPLTQGKKITVSLSVLADNGRDVKQWLIDLHNAIVVEYHDPADCLEDSCSPEYRLSVLVSGGKAMASAKRTN
jgi:hypothetical protein